MKAVAVQPAAAPARAAYRPASVRVGRVVAPQAVPLRVPVSAPRPVFGSSIFSPIFEERAQRLVVAADGERGRSGPRQHDA